jgi:hypothetical protein
MTQIARTLLLGAQAFWRDLTRDWLGSYHPELHYMRGPGPKWREKHDYALVPVSRPRRGQPRLQD